MRFKFDRNDPNTFRCLCCHVRTGTICLGLFHLFAHILILSLFAVLAIHPEILPLKESLPTDVVDINGTLFSYDTVKQINLRDENTFLAFLMICGSMLFVLMLLYGAIRGQHGYILPFFCMQVFDFCIFCLTVLNWFSYSPNVKIWIAQQAWLREYADCLLNMDDWMIMLMSMVVVFCAITVKLYLLGMVWGCYKYLVYCNQNVTQGRFNIPYNAENPEDTEMLLPPKYEDVLRMSAEEPQPPAYEENEETHTTSRN